MVADVVVADRIGIPEGGAGQTLVIDLDSDSLGGIGHRLPDLEHRIARRHRADHGQLRRFSVERTDIILTSRPHLIEECVGLVWIEREIALADNPLGRPLLPAVVVGPWIISPLRGGPGDDSRDGLAIDQMRDRPFAFRLAEAPTGGFLNWSCWERIAMSGDWPDAAARCGY